jgi:hypothetical protein
MNVSQTHPTESRAGTLPADATDEYPPICTAAALTQPSTRTLKALEISPTEAAASERHVQSRSQATSANEKMQNTNLTSLRISLAGVLRPSALTGG